jgi:hypothetical protein
MQIAGTSLRSRSRRRMLPEHRFQLSPQERHELRFNLSAAAVAH